MPSNDDLYSDIAADVQSAQTVDTLDLVRGLALELLAAQIVVADREDALKRAKDALKDIEENRLPTLMKTKQLPSFTFASADGTSLKVELDEDFQISVTTGAKGTVDKRPAANAFFREIGQAGLIKKEFVVNLGLRGDNEVGDLVGPFKAANPSLSTKIEEYIEPATLRAHIKARLKSGKHVPTDVFTIFPQTKAKVKAS